jgi:tight adherence protein B
MMPLAQIDGLSVIANVLVLVGSGVAVYVGWPPLRDVILSQERWFERVLQRKLLLGITPRTATVIEAVGILIAMLIAYALSKLIMVAVLIGGVCLLVPFLIVRLLERQRLRRLEDQLVNGIQTLASGVRAGLNLVQSMQLVARDGPAPLRQEVAHLLQEYEYGVSLEDAMENAVQRIGSGDYRLLFAALQTHRQRGGDLGDTLDRIADSIREIQRLEKRVESLTAQGRATARWLGAMPPIVLGLMFLLVDPEAVSDLFTLGIGRLLLLTMVVLTIIGFLWIKKIVSVDV